MYLKVEALGEIEIATKLLEDDAGMEVLFRCCSKIVLLF